MKKYLLIIAVLFCGTQLEAQTARETELISTIADKTAALEALAAEVDGMQAELDGIPFNGWKYGGAGVGSFTLADFSNWVQGNAPGSSVIVANIGLFGDYEKDKLFWNNTLDLKAGYQKLDVVGSLDPSADSWNKNLDELFFSTLAGYKISDVWAVSALGDFRSTWLQEFGDPGQFSIGVGLTYKPNSNFVFGIHPITLQGTIAKSITQKIANEIDKNLTDDEKFGTRTDMGVKLFYDYNREILKDLLFYSNLNAFAPYSDFSEYNVTWTNGLAYSLGKFITVNFEYGLRYYEPEQNGFFAENHFAGLGDDVPTDLTIEQIEGLPGYDGDDWQSRYVLGIGFSTNFGGNKRF